MKNSICTLGLALFLSAPLFTACDSIAQKKQNNKEELKQLTQDEKDRTAEENKAEDWAVFKAETEKRIAVNAERIAEIRQRKAKPGRALDGVYAAQIDGIQQRNGDLQVRLDAYEKKNSDWEKFKREFNHDMDELGKALEDLGKNNTK